MNPTIKRLAGTIGLVCAASQALAAPSTVSEVNFLGVVEIPSFTEFEGTTVGGLSGIARDPISGAYVAVSDDRGAGADGTPRIYNFAIDLGDDSLDDGDVTISSVQSLFTSTGETLDVINPDPEGIAFDPAGKMYISSERNNLGRVPEVWSFNSSFEIDGSLPVPAKFSDDGSGTTGVYNNNGFESLTITPDGNTLYTATEASLEQDGSRASTSEGSNARVLTFDLASGTAGAEYIYQVDPIAIPSDAFADSGLVELLALDNEGTFLALERSFSIGAPERGYTGKLYEYSIAGATDVSGDDPLADFLPGSKRLLADLGADFGIVVDNIEGLVFGPTTSEGLQSLIIVSDDNFSAFGPQANQFIALGLAISSVPASDSFLILLGVVSLLGLRHMARLSR